MHIRTAILLLPLLALPARAADAFSPVPASEQAQYRFNFRKVFFKDDAAFRSAEKAAERQVKEIEALKGKVTASPRNLYQAWKLADDFSVTFGRVYVYQYLQYAVNTRNTAPRDRAADTESRLAPRLAFVTTETQKLTPARFQEFLKAYPPLAKYRYPITESLRAKAHTLSLSDEELLGRTDPLMTKWQEDMYDLLLDRYPWGKVKDPATGKDLDVRQDEVTIGNSTDRDVRRQGAELTAAGYRAQRDLFAFDFVNRARTRNKLAQMRHFKNNLDARFFDIHLTYDDVQTAYSQILARGDLRKRLQTMQRARIQAFTGYDTVHSYDMTVVPPGVEKPRFTIDQATRIIEASTAYLGPEYNRELANLLNPANGRLDIVAGANRVPGAFTYTMQEGQSPFFDYGYQGFLDDVSTLAHESGHAVHQSMMNNARIPPATMGGPSFFTESYAIFNELVLADKLYREEKDPGRKVYYLEHLLQQMMGFYGTVRIAAVEKAGYEGVEKGTIKTADDLDRLTGEIGRKVSIWHDLEPAETNLLWSEVEHYYRSGTQYENYVFADLLAQTYFTMYKKDPAAFAKRFTALMRNGFNDTPTNLLKKFMGINLKDKATYNAVFAQQERYLNDLEQLYQSSVVSRQ
ncbi:MAG TPA: M3 family metallopeptidase [Armatimonadota bacterium]|jgi:oligoendopeptidase F